MAQFHQRNALRTHRFRVTLQAIQRDGPALQDIDMLLGL